MLRHTQSRLITAQCASSQFCAALASTRKSTAAANKDAAPRPSLCAPLRSSPRPRRWELRKRVRHGPAKACAPKASLAPAPHPCARADPRCRGALVEGACNRILRFGRVLRLGAPCYHHDALALNFVVGLLVDRLEFLNRLLRLRDDFLMLRQFRLAPDTGVGGIFRGGRCGRRHNGTGSIASYREL
jgi:hypothetical protein